MRIQLGFLTLITAACGKPFWHPRPVASEPFPEPSSAAEIEAISIERVQRATATLDSATFATVTHPLLDRGFFRLQSVYSTGTTDVTYVTVRAVLPDTIKTVVEEEAAGPTALHEIQGVLDSIASRLSWEVVPRPN